MTPYGFVGNAMGKRWTKGRGKLGFMQPLLGRWVAETDTPMGRMRCTRELTEILGGARIKLEARWEMAGPKAQVASAAAGMAGREPYQEIAIVGPGDKGQVCFWSFTSDGKRSEGWEADVTDVHEEAVGFEAQMPAGLARMIYWPAPDGGMMWAVEAKNKKGWKRFTEHHYHPA
jgi:hypothetical protein